MVERFRQRPAALKHGGFSGATLLPGEDPVAFKKLHAELVAEFTPCGALECEIIDGLARLLWRKRNLSTYRLAALARDRIDAIKYELLLRNELIVLDNPEEDRAQERAVDAQARKELSAVWELVEIGQVATTEYLLAELTLIDRLDGMIDRCLKRLLMVRGVKSMSAIPPKAGLPPPLDGNASSAT